MSLSSDAAVILDLAVDAIVVIDETGHIRFANKALQSRFGWAPEELIGQNVSVLMPSPDRERHDEYLKRYLCTGQARIIGIGRQVTAQRKDGSTFPIHLAVSEVELDGRRHFAGFLRDISDLARMEAAHAEERKFLSRELHDSVSQALFGICMGTQAAMNCVDGNRPAREALDYVLSLAESGLAEMRALILELRPESLEAEGLTGSLARQARAVARRYGLELDLDLGPEPEFPIETKHQCFRIAMEAIHNVVKHAQAHRLTIRFQPGFSLTVQDDGNGFRPEDVPPARVGLVSMAERAQRLGGQLRIDSAPGRGTEVSLSLPDRPAGP